MARLGSIGYERQRQESFAPSLADTVSPMQHLTGAVDSGLQNDPSGQGREEEWQQCLGRLQELVVELLIRNQQLRMSLLDSATNSHSMDANETRRATDRD